MSGGGGGSADIKETPAEQTQARIAAEKWQLYKDDFQQAENEFMRLTDELGTEGRADLAEQAGSQAAQVAGAGAMDEAIGTVTQGGVNPASGRFQGVVAAGGRGLGERAGSAMNEANRGMRRLHLSRMQNVADLGMGQSTEAQSGISQVAGMAQSEAIDKARNEFNQTTAMQNLAGTAVGLGASGAASGLSGGAGSTDATITDTNLRVPDPPPR